MPPRLSVLMPVYNAAATLPGALDSVLGQTYRDFEFIVVDDGSTDGSLAMLRERAAADDRLRVIAAPHAGLVAALQRAAEAARGELIGRMDADDACSSERFVKQVALLDTSGAEVVSCRVELTGALSECAAAAEAPGMAHYVDWLNTLSSHDDLWRERFIESPVAHPSVLMRRTAFDGAGGYQDNGWAEDYDLWLRLFEAGATFAKCPEVLLQWRDAPTRASRADSRYSIENFLRCKTHYLVRALLPEDRPFRIWGAGRYGKKLGKRLLEYGRAPLDYIDIDPRKIGGHVAPTARPGPDDRLIPVVGIEQLGVPGGPLILVAVGSRGSSSARDDIRATLATAGFREAIDFWCVA